jgi:hypothetical protein
MKTKISIVVEVCFCCFIWVAWWKPTSVVQQVKDKVGKNDVQVNTDNANRNTRQVKVDEICQLWGQVGKINKLMKSTCGWKWQIWKRKWVKITNPPTFKTYSLDKYKTSLPTFWLCRQIHPLHIPFSPTQKVFLVRSVLFS